LKLLWQVAEKQFDEPLSTKARNNFKKIAISAVDYIGDNSFSL
jgi:hypothetical protein